MEEDRYEMQIRTKNGAWEYFDDKALIKDLDCYDLYANNIHYDARIIKITTSKHVIKSTID